MSHRIYRGIASPFEFTDFGERVTTRRLLGLLSVAPRDFTRSLLPFVPSCCSWESGNNSQIWEQLRNNNDCDALFGVYLKQFAVSAGRLKPPTLREAGIHYANRPVSATQTRSGSVATLSLTPKKDSAPGVRLGSLALSKKCNKLALGSVTRRTQSGLQNHYL